MYVHLAMHGNRTRGLAGLIIVGIMINQAEDLEITSPRWTVRRQVQCMEGQPAGIDESQASCHSRTVDLALPTRRSIHIASH